MAGSSGPDIITDGLILALDAGDNNSYDITTPVASTTLKDLSGSGNDGTLANGPVYNASNGGSIAFDGSNDYISIPHSSSISLSTALTLSVWFYSGDNDAILYLKGRTDYDHYNPYLSARGRYGWVGANGRAFYDPPTGFIQANTWYNLTVSHSSGNTPIVYKNSVASSSHSFSEGNGSYILGTNSWRVGINADVERGTISSFNGRVSSIQVYNRALTVAEISQNFSALRSRFGI